MRPPAPRRGRVNERAGPLPSANPAARSAEGRPMTAPILELAGVHTHIGAYHILHGVDFAVPEGQVTMLLGRNGAGK